VNKTNRLRIDSVFRQIISGQALKNDAASIMGRREIEVPGQTDWLVPSTQVRSAGAKDLT